MTSLSGSWEADSTREPLSVAMVKAYETATQTKRGSSRQFHHRAHPVRDGGTSPVHITAESTGRKTRRPSAAVLVPVRLDALALPVEWLMVETCIVDAALIPSPLVPAALIRPPLISSPWAAEAAIVADVRTVILSTVSAVVTLAVLCPTRLTRVGDRHAGSCSQHNADRHPQCCGDCGLGHRLLTLIVQLLCLVR